MEYLGANVSGVSDAQVFWMFNQLLL